MLTLVLVNFRVSITQKVHCVHTSGLTNMLTALKNLFILTF